MANPRKTMPDVGSLFRAHFGDASRSLNLVFGSDSNFVHNLEFLSVLTHESLLRASEVRWKEGGPIRFPMLRERTELPLLEAGTSLVRRTVDSLLTIQPVSAVSWVFHRELPQPLTDLEIFSIHLGLDFWNGECDAFTLHLVGQMWRCDLTVSSRRPAFRLSDTSNPK